MNLVLQTDVIALVSVMHALKMVVATELNYEKHQTI